LVRGVTGVMMWKFDTCPRCGGDVFVDRDIDGWYEQCLQCSYRNDLKSTAEYKEQPSSKKEAVITGKKARVLLPFA